MKNVYYYIRRVLFCLVLCTLFSTPVKADTYQQNWCKLPQEMRDVLVEDGWTIIEENDLETKFGFDRPVMAVTRYQEHTIWLEPRKNDNALLHECFHALDEHYFELLGYYPSDVPEFEAIRLEEVNTMAKAFTTSKYNYNTSEEYWAEAGQNIVLFPTWMAKHCPLTYNYITSYIK